MGMVNDDSRPARGASDDAPSNDAPDAAPFDAMFARDADPWRFRERWYERRKRMLTLASLPRERYRRAFEAGCANGELAAALATRSDALVAADFSARAIEHAQARLARHPHVRVERRTLPDEWPPGAFDLVVLSELVYYLTPAETDALIERLRDTITDDATVLACHWLHPFDGAAQRPGPVHATLGARLGLTRLVHHEETDLLLDVWSTDERSVAQREGFA